MRRKPLAKARALILTAVFALMCAPGLGMNASAENVSPYEYGDLTIVPADGSTAIIAHAENADGSVDTVYLLIARDVTITGSPSSTNVVLKANDNDARITLNNVCIDASGSDGCAFMIEDGYAEPVTVVLEGNNTLISGGSYSGIHKSSSGSGKLTITGSGSLTVAGGNGAAGIGAGAGISANNIEIDCPNINGSVWCGDWFVQLNSNNTGTGEGNSAEILRYTGTDETVVVPDAFYKYYPVAAIGESAFANNTAVKSVIIPDSVISIGGGAFSGCTSLTDITIPDGVTSIGDGAFSGCISLADITIPDGVTSIGDGAFSGCTDLTVHCNEYSAADNYLKNHPEIKGDITHVHRYNTVWSRDDTYHWYECKCGDRINESAHTEDGGTVTTEPAHAEAGVMTYTCTVCGYSRTEEIPALGHTFGEEWKFDAVFHWHECGCGEKSDFSPHVSDSGTVTTPATSATAGTMTYTCTICGCSWTSDIAPAGSYPPSGTAGTSFRSSVKTIVVTGLDGANGYSSNISEDYIEVRISSTDEADAAGQSAINALDVNYLYTAFDMSLFDKNGNVLTLENSESITFEIPVPENMQASQNIVMYHIPDGNPEKISSTTFNNGGKKYVRFTANKFSPYMMAAADIEDVSSSAVASGNSEPIEPVSQSRNLPDAILPENKKIRRRHRYRVVSKG